MSSRVGGRARPLILCWLLLVLVPGGGLARDEYEIAATIDRADAMQLTLLDRAFPGDTEFPAYESKVGKVWRETIRERGSWWDFVDYERIR